MVMGLMAFQKMVVGTERWTKMFEICFLSFVNF
jgi:hypothetical protein